jgi:3-(methylthio)propanoyl-CoA dehydrogenase
VLARIEGAPAGIKGISLFAVPKVLIGPDGSLGERNDVHCVSIEHKLGLHASPTCVMSYGDHAGAVGYLVGEANHGLQYMFIMMNAARLGVGVQGVGLSELALQQARAWANQRIQGRPMGVQGEGPFPIIYHPDVARMLLTMRANVEAMRALSLSAALELDRARGHSAQTQRQASLWRGELLIPIVKGWCTELAGAMASLAIQVHGGMGFIEETGVAQTLRDARISAIYEGTTAIQANDLLGRKLGRDQGAAMAALLVDWAAALDLPAAQATDPVLAGIVAGALESITLLRHTTDALLRQAAALPRAALGVSVPYLMLCGRVLGGVLLARSAVIASRRLAGSAADPAFYRAKLQTARFYIEQLLPEALGLVQVVEHGGSSVAEAAPELI